jgi:primosomal protein N' (replication factor Y)
VTDAGTAPRTAARRVRVLLPLPLPAALDYRVAEGEPPPAPGSFVRVPLGTRHLIGVVWDGGAETQDAEFAAERLKPIGERLALPALDLT